MYTFLEASYIESSINIYYKATYIRLAESIFNVKSSKHVQFLTAMGSKEDYGTFIIEVLEYDLTKDLNPNPLEQQVNAHHYGMGKLMNLLVKELIC